MNTPSTERRRSAGQALRHVRWAVGALHHGKNGHGVGQDIASGGGSPTKLNGRLTQGGQPDVSLIQTLHQTGQESPEEFISAARDGLIDIVESHLAATANIYTQTFDEDGYTALHHAARYNRVKVLEALIKAGVNVNIRGGHDEVTPLHLACRYDSGTATQVLLTCGAGVNNRDLKGRTPLHYATRRGHDMVTKMLLSVNNCDVNVADADHVTPLIMAAMEGNSHICELLVTRGASIGQKDINDMTPLMWAASECHIGVVALFLKTAGKNSRGTDISMKIPLAHKHGNDTLQGYVRLADNEGNTALHLAVQNGSSEITEMLLNHFADIDAQKLNQTTALHVAASNGDKEIAELLIFHGAKVNKKDMEQMTPIHKAALYNRVDLLQLLMKNGSDINAKDKKNMLALHHACWKGQTRTVEFLLQCGAQVAEADSSLKTALHWAVQFGHYETLVALLKHGVSNILEASDKNDQTVLHYAAYFGNVSVLKTLLEAGSKPFAKDQEERTPLHIAAQYDNVSCVEALIQASGHEINDDDIDGRTPLLLACTYGHHQVVQVLLSLGADVYKRDDEHRTSLMLASANGHSYVMKILLENQANVNDADKNKSTALHYACGGGHTEAVHLLLYKRADVTVKNTHNAAPLDLAIDNMHGDVATTMLKSKSWRDCLSVRDVKGNTVMDRLIEKLPEAAKIVLDRCVERSTRDDDDPNLNMVFDYQYIDPGPDEMVPKQCNRYFALNTMVSYERDTLLSHPLCQNVLSQKWVKFGRRTFYLNLFVYIAYLVSLNLYVISVDAAITERFLDNSDARCPIILPESQKYNNTFIDMMKKNNTSDLRVSQFARLFGYLSQIFVIIIALKELFKMYSQRLRYFINFFNLMAWTLLGATFAFTFPGGQMPCLLQWRAGWIAMFFAWINFIMYLRRIDFVGIYVIMFVTVLISLMKAILLFLFFSWAFASAFYIVMSGKKNSDEETEWCKNDEKCHFQPILHSLMNVFIMSLGEIDKVKDWLAITPDVFYTDTLILLGTFLFLMPLVLMNLLIGIAVGDIEKVQHNAYLKRIALQVDFLYHLENNMPKFMQRKVFIRRAAIKPNEGRNSKLDKITRILFGSSKSVQFIQTEQKDRVHYKLDRINEEFQQTQAKVSNLQASIQQQTALLQQIAGKLDMRDTVGGFAPQDLASIPFADDCNLSIYDNLSLAAPKVLDRSRYKSIRMEGQERPQSVVI